LTTRMENICLFCGSSIGNKDVYRRTARKLVGELVKRNIGIVYGGGKVGLMGEIADAVLELGGRVIGVMPRHLVEKEIAHKGLTALHVVETIHERKRLMSELADAFIALPGGYGTLEELFEILSWAELGIHQKPCGILDVNGFYQPLIRFLDFVQAEGFLRTASRKLVLVKDEAMDLVETIIRYDPVRVDKW
jgi:uncharacterized protein (TIGR00730 family)